VLTAAHCVKGGWAIDIWTITVGTNLLDVPQSYNQTFKIEDIVIHPDFEVKSNCSRVNPTEFVTDLDERRKLLIF